MGGRFFVLMGGAALAALVATPAAAESLRDAMAAAYANNPVLAGARAGQQAVSEGVVQQLGEFRPTVGAQAALNQETTGPGRFNDMSRLVTVGVQLSQPVYRGGRLQAGLKAAKNREIAGREQLRGTENQTIFDTVVAYMDVLRLQAEVDLTSNQVRVLERQLQASNDRFEVGDLTREPLEFPLDRDLRLQALARGDEGFLLALGYSTQRGYGRTHPFVGEIRIGEVEVEFDVPELGFAISLGRIRVTECQMVNGFKGNKDIPPQFTRGYGLVFGQAERKAMAMSLCDRALRARELGEDITAPAQDEEFVISHSDNVQATGFVEHLKLPHYVDFQAELDLLRRMRATHEADIAEAAE